MFKRVIFPLALFAAVIVIILYVYNLPVVYDRVSWRMDSLKADIKYALNPPEQAVFVPSSQERNPAVSPGLGDVTRTPTPTISLTRITPLTTTPTAFPTPTRTPSPTPPPPAVKLEGFTHEFQMWNNCSPANLSMALSFWGWEGTQRDTAAFLKPNDRDKNVMPYEMVDYVEEQTELEAITRVGGDIDMLKALLSSGYPVIVETGYEGVEFEDWMGHYQVITGYDDAEQQFIAQDSYKGPDFVLSYADLVEAWRAFNYTYIVLYPPEREAQVLNILGPHANAYENFSHAADLAAEDTERLSGRDLFFAYFNLGSNHVNLNDYGNAAVAFDAAFANYPEIPEDQRPWRMMWYQTGPYFAYYYTGRYEDMIELADTTLGAMAEPVLEESYYWRAKAKLALGDEEGAVEDFQKSLEVHPEFTPSVDELLRLGVQL